MIQLHCISAESLFEPEKGPPQLTHTNLYCFLVQKTAVKRTESLVDLPRQYRLHLYLMAVHGRAVVSWSLFQDLHRKATLSVTGRFQSHSGLISTMMRWLVKNISTSVTLMNCSSDAVVFRDIQMYVFTCGFNTTILIIQWQNNVLLCLEAAYICLVIFTYLTSHTISFIWYCIWVCVYVCL